ncbi:MAG: glycosyltransferase [Bacteroidales bacterium]|jgi:glycosyltransferase involved in cell wall biosynthesis|nr:glycosyltransferase [Bacteroidales bacterium]
MTFAYLILVHKNPGQLLRLVNALNADRVYFFIHVDYKIDETLFKSIIDGNNIFFCERRKTVNWGGFSVTEAIMELIREMIVKIGFPDYVHLMSGQDFPIKSNEYIFNYFEKHKGTNFLEYFPLPSAIWNDGMKRIQYNWHIDDLGYTKAAESVRTQEPHDFLPDILPYGGFTWWSFTGECVSHIFNECKQGGKLYEYYRYTLLSDEMLFHTLLMNSKYKNTIVNYNLRKIDWSTGGPHPKLWKMEDIKELLASPRLFARKFDENIDSEILDKLEVHIREKFLPKTKTKNPSISIVMPMYNVQNFLRETVDSILKQTFADFELIIVDDGSIDNSVNIVKSYNDKRIHLILAPHDFINSLNTGTSKAKGKYIARMDADDIMPVDRLEVQFEFMEKNPKIDICVGWMQFFGNSDHLERVPAKHDEITNRLMYRNFAMHPTAMLRRKIFCSGNIKYEENYPYAEDYKLWTDIIKAGFRFSGIQRVLNYYRNHNEQVTVTKHNEMNESAFKIQVDYVEYLMEMMVNKNNKYFDLINGLIGAANENLIQTRQLIDIAGSIHKAFLVNQEGKQPIGVSDKDHKVKKKYLIGNFNDVIKKYKDCEYESGKNINHDKSPVWICWWDGEDAMPEVVKICYKSVCDNAGTHPVNLIAKNNYHKFISIPDYIIEKVSGGMITVTHLSDILRMCLLYEHGGLWLDATVYVTSNIDSSIFESDLITIRNSSMCFHETKYNWASFCIGGQNGHPFFAFMKDMLLEYWNKKNEMIDYFLVDYCIVTAYDKIPAIRNMFNKIPHSNPQLISLSQNLGNVFDVKIYEQICSDTDFHKLSWKRSYPERTDSGKLTLYGHLLNEYLKTT